MTTVEDLAIDVGLGINTRTKNIGNIHENKALYSSALHQHVLRRQHVHLSKYFCPFGDQVLTWCDHPDPTDDAHIYRQIVSHHCTHFWLGEAQTCLIFTTQKENILHMHNLLGVLWLNVRF
jgi:hypothetical protein